MTLRESRSADGSSTPLERVQNHSLPERSISWIERYDELIGDRDRFLWQWAHHLFPKFTLSSVAPVHADTVQDAKLFGLMYVSILDDIAEKHEDRPTFEEAAKIPFVHQTVNDERDGVDPEVVTFASDIWEEFSTTIAEGPRADEFGDILRFDLKQVLNAIDYSYLGNQHLEVLTRSELQTYDSHNMMLFGFAGVDLIHSPRFDKADLSTLRRVIERAQRMVRIGNWVTTWEREVAEGDFTSGVVGYALDQDLVSVEGLEASQADGGRQDAETIVQTIHEHAVEDVFLRQWQEELSTARRLERDVDSVDVEAYLDGIETVMDYHLASRGLK